MVKRHINKATMAWRQQGIGWLEVRVKAGRGTLGRSGFAETHKPKL